MKRLGYIALALLVVSCGEETNYDAQGTFEATEVVVSAEASGRILNLDVEEGMPVEKGDIVGTIDTMQLHLQRKQLVAQREALLGSRPDIKKQAAGLREQIATQRGELARVENMLRDGAATTKQRDDLTASIALLESQLDATLSTLNNNTATINSNAEALDAQIAALDDRIAKCHIVAPASGTVLVKYAEEGEIAAMGKPLFKVANLDNIYLRAYFTSDQLADIELGDEVTVTADYGDDERFDYKGRISWISSESEFTPKTIQTKESRANLVYAVKIAVENDGRLKIGMAGEVVL